MKILGISGKKQSGKNTASNFILGSHLLHNGVVKNRFSITDDGQLWVSDIYGEEGTDGVLNQDCQTDEMYQWFCENIYPVVKIYSFADPLKQMCINILGLTHDQCYGTNEQKDSLTKLKWEDMPDTISPKCMSNGTGSLSNYLMSQVPTLHGGSCVVENSADAMIEGLGLTLSKDEYMTARQVLQYVGTNIFRKMYGDVWVDATLRQIQIEQPSLAIISDVRFPNEVIGTKESGGKVIRLERAPFNEDAHESESALDKPNFRWGNFDGILKNSDSTIACQNEELYNLLQPWGYLPTIT